MSQAMQELATQSPPPAPSVARRRHKPIMREVIETIILTAILFFLARAAVQPFRVDGHSMDYTLHNNEVLLVDKISYDLHAPQRGDIIVFKFPLDPTRDFIKRVIGLPGDKVSVQNGKVFVNGVALTEPYEAQPPDYGPQSAVTVPAKSLYVLGDNRNNSYDSHSWGFVPYANIIGRAFLAYWPPSDLALLTHPAYPAVLNGK